MKPRLPIMLFTLFSCLFSIPSIAAVVDRDSDGYIEINSLDDLNEIRNAPEGKTLRGSSEGCPSQTGCFGYELTRNLNFDSNNDGVVNTNDWNQGQSWQPIPELKNAVFDGNFYTISNLKITNLPASSSYVGLFATITNSTLRNLRMQKSVITLDHSAYLMAGTVFSVATGSHFTNIKVENASISLPSDSDAFRQVGGIGSSLIEGSLTDSSFVDGEVITLGQIDRMGGLLGSAQRSEISGGAVKARLESHSGGGIVGGAEDTNISTSFSNINIVSRPSQIGIGSVGGIAGEFVGKTRDIFLTSSYATGSITDGLGGGLVGLARPNYEDSKTLNISTSYSAVKNNFLNTNWGQLISLPEADEYIVISASYQVTNPDGVNLTTYPISLTRSITSAALACNSNQVGNCTQPKALLFWSSSEWNFGDTSQWPELLLPYNSAWINGDTPSDSGDYETFTNMAKKDPAAVCQNPIDFQATVKNSGYVFSAKTPEKFDYFNAKQGLKCTGSNQSDHCCNDYVVSYLCPAVNGAQPYWTDWINNDAVADGNENESPTSSVCAGASPEGIRTRAALNSTEIFYGAPQILQTFNLTAGLRCRNDDNGTAGLKNCKEYYSRMVCITKSSQLIE